MQVGDILISSLDTKGLKKGKSYVISYTDKYKVVFGDYNNPDAVIEPWKVYLIFYTNKELRKLKLKSIENGI